MKRADLKIGCLCELAWGRKTTYVHTPWQTLCSTAWAEFHAYYCQVEKTIVREGTVKGLLKAWHWGTGVRQLSTSCLLPLYNALLLPVWKTWLDLHAGSSCLWSSGDSFASWGTHQKLDSHGFFSTLHQWRWLFPQCGVVVGRLGKEHWGPEFKSPLCQKYHWITSAWPTLQSCCEDKREGTTCAPWVPCWKCSIKLIITQVWKLSNYVSRGQIQVLFHWYGREDLCMMTVYAGVKSNLRTFIFPSYYRRTIFKTW